MERRFARALATLGDLFKDASVALRVPIHFALIGGLGMSAWGAVRATQDIDILADTRPGPLRNLALRDRLQRLFEEKGCVPEWRVGDRDDPIPLLLRLELPRRARGMAVDIIWAHKRWQRQALRRRITLRVSGLKLFVLHPEDLILMKLEAGGPQDLLDVEALLSSSPTELILRSLKQRAARLHLGRVLDRCLHSSRRKPTKL
jgi:hypothetical protein